MNRVSKFMVGQPPHSDDDTPDTNDTSEHPTVPPGATVFGHAPVASGTHTVSAYQTRLVMIEADRHAATAMTLGVISFLMGPFGCIVALLALEQAERAKRAYRTYPQHVSAHRETPATVGGVLATASLLMSVIALIVFAYWARDTLGGWASGLLDLIVEQPQRFTM